jgi:hypothetical protein
MYKYLISIFLLLPFSVLAQNVDPLGSLNTAASGTGLVTNKKPVEIIVQIINIILTFVGSIFMILIIWAGFKWMTSAGNTDAIKKSRETIINAVIGLAVILASYVIVNFVIRNLVLGIGVGNGTGGSPATVAD